MVPLAEKRRPQKLTDVVGQDHIIGQGKIIKQIIKNKQPVSLILWGPPGSGKTTLARIIAKESDADFVELSAVTSGKAEIKKIVEYAQQNYRLGTKTILFVDEIHRFNKAQQDAFLPHLENGTIVLIGATTENPSFEIINPLLSRARVITLQTIAKIDMVKIIKRASKAEGLDTKRLPSKSIDLIADLSAGDARVALGNLELSIQLSKGKPITAEVIKTAAQTKLPSYDKQGENHYNLISAFIKSMRGGDTNASLYYLARMLEAGEDPKFIARRMIIFASEDIGMSAPAALNIAVSTFQAVELIGLPEAKYALFHCATVMAKAPKSRDITDAMNKALDLAQQYPNLPVPLHLRNAPTKLMKDLGYGKETKWEPGFKHPKGFLPPEISKYKTT